MGIIVMFIVYFILSATCLLFGFFVLNIKSAIYLFIFLCMTFLLALFLFIRDVINKDIIFINKKEKYKDKYKEK